MRTQREEERRRLEELYRDMGDVELETLAREAYTLTDLAKQVLESELSVRKMDVPLSSQPVSDAPVVMDGLDLVVFRRVRNMDEARWLKGILERAGVASCLGPDNLSRLEDFHGEFDGGVDLRIFETDFRLAASVTRGLFPPEAGEEVEPALYEARCPKCRSEEIVFEGREGLTEAEPDLDAKFNWTCDACGHQWKDDGLMENEAEA